MDDGFRISSILSFNHFNDDVWIDGVLDEYRMHRSDGKEDDIIISDVRHEKEYVKIVELGGIIIKVIRQNVVSIDTHSSETQIDSLVGDYTIYNHSTIEKLRTEINNILIMRELK